MLPFEPGMGRKPPWRVAQVFNNVMLTLGSTRSLKQLAVSWLGLCGILCLANEPIRFSYPAELVTIPEFKRANNSRKVDFESLKSRAESATFRVFYVPPSSSGGRPLSKKQRDALEERRNWAFNTPQDMAKQPTALEALHVTMTGKETDDTRNKPLARYLNGDSSKSQSGDSESEMSGRNADGTGPDPGEASEFSDNSDRKDNSNAAKNRDKDKDKESDGEFDRNNKDKKSNLLFPGPDANPDQRQNDPYMARLNRLDVSKDRLVPAPSLSDFARNKKETESPARSLLQSGGLMETPISGDMLSGVNDLTRKEINPVVGRSMGDGVKGFTGKGAMPDPVSSFRLKPGQGLGGVLDDLSAKRLGVSSLAPAIMPVPEPPRIENRPVVFELPRRKF